MTVTIPKRYRVANRLAHVLTKRACSTADLLAVTGMKYGTLVTGLRHLRLAGLLTTTTIPPTGMSGRPRKQYAVHARVV